MNRFLQGLDRVLGLFLVVLMVLMVLSITTEIVLNAGIQRLGAWLEKDWNAVGALSTPVNTLSQTLLVWIGILGSALAWRLRAHLGVDALVRVYPARLRLIMDYAATLLVGIFAALVLVYGGYRVCYLAFSRDMMMPGLEFINRGWFYLVLPLTGVLILIYCVDHLMHPKPVHGGLPDQPCSAEEGQLHDA